MLTMAKDGNPCPSPNLRIEFGHTFLMEPFLLYFTLLLQTSLIEPSLLHFTLLSHMSRERDYRMSRYFRYT